MKLLLSPNRKFCYIGIYKNASTTYCRFLEYNKWTEISVNNANKTRCKFFSHIQNPMNRYYKGVAEIINVNKNNRVLLVPNLIKTVFLDDHILPISILTHNIKRDITFIPIDTDISSNELTNNFFTANNLDLFISKSNAVNISHKTKKKLQGEVKEILQKDNHHLVSSLYSKDNELYNKSIKPINPDDLVQNDSWFTKWYNLFNRSR